MLTNEELAALIEVGVESRRIEFKGPGSTSSTEFVAVVARACIALANQRDGGHLVIGVVDRAPGGGTGGLTTNQVTGWMDYDTVVSKVNAYADPPLQLRLDQRRLPNGNPVVVVEVAEFAEIPILSAKEFSGKIHRGQLYTRSMAKPESSAQNTQNEMREVLALATEKQLQIFLRTARHAGLAVEAGGPTDRDLFAAERTAFFQQPLAKVVADKPRMVAVVRPESYREDLLGYEALESLVADNAVRFRGWPFPFVQNVVTGDRWVGEAQESMHPEAWALHQSGQFLVSRSLPLGYGPDPDGFADAIPTGRYLPVWFPVMFILEATSFAARLQRKALAREPLHVEIAMENGQGWELVVADETRSGFHGSYRFGSSTWQRNFTLKTDVIADDVKNLAAEMSYELLLRFGWKGVSPQIIREMQNEVVR